MPQQNRASKRRAEKEGKRAAKQGVKELQLPMDTQPQMPLLSADELFIHAGQLSFSNNKLLQENDRLRRENATLKKNLEALQPEPETEEKSKD